MARVFLKEEKQKSYKELVSEKDTRILILGLSASIVVIEVIPEEEWGSKSPKTLGQKLSCYVSISDIQANTSQSSGYVWLGAIWGTYRLFSRCLWAILDSALFAVFRLCCYFEYILPFIMAPKHKADSSDGSAIKKGKPSQWRWK